MSVEKNSESGFKISDRRIAGKDEAEKQKILQQEESGPASKSEISGLGADGGGGSAAEMSRDESVPEGQGEFIPLDFSSFILSLWTSALIQLGEIADPIRKSRGKNLPAAKQTIDLIAMLQEKTKGNLTGQEQNTIDQLLYDLRMKYVKQI